MERRNFLTAAAVAPLGAALPGPAAPSRTRLLEGKIAVIYGAAGSVGAAVSRAFANEGAHVLVTGRTLARVDALAKEIVQAGGVATPAEVNALDASAIDKHLADAVRRLGRIDISFNLINLGGPQGASLVAMNPPGFYEPIDNAMRTHFLTATAAARHMAPRRSGVILALTAQVARKPYFGSGGFGVACAAIEGLCRQLAADLGPDGIRVVALRSSGSPDSPGVRDAIAEHAKAAGVTREAFEARIADKTLLKRMPLLAEVAHAATLVASDRASAITAAVTNVTCGEIAD